MPTTWTDEEVGVEAPKPETWTDEDVGIESPKPVPEISIKLSPYEQADIGSGGKARTGMENDSDLLRAMAEDPKAIPGAVAQGAMLPFSVAGKLVNAAAQDVGTTLSGHPEYGGNVLEFFQRTSPQEAAVPMPFQQTLADVSKTSPVTATAGKIASGLVESAPMMVGGLPEGIVGKLIALGFTADMIRNAGPAGTAIGEEMGKPADQRDMDKITGAVAELAQAGVFAPLMATHILKRAKAAEFQGPMATGEVLQQPAGYGPRPKIQPPRPVVPETPAENRAVPTPEQEQLIEHQQQIKTVRAMNATTKAAVQKLFPDMNRQQAAQLRDEVWGKEEAATPEAPASPDDAPIAEPAKAATPLDIFYSQLETGDIKGGNKLSKAAGAAVTSIDDLNTLADLQERYSRQAKEVRAMVESAKTPEEKMAMMNQAIPIGQKASLAREAIEYATNSGSWKEGEGRISYGKRPLDWRDNPEVEKWIEGNANRIGWKQSEIEGKPVEHASLKGFREDQQARKAGAPTDTPEDLQAQLRKEFEAVPPSPEAPESGMTAGPGPAKPADIISRLESLKLKRGPSGTASLPHPEALKAIGRDVWNTAIDVAIASIKAGRAISGAIDDAISHIKKKVKAFDETKLRNNLNSAFLPQESATETPVQHIIRQATGMGAEKPSTISRVLDTLQSGMATIRALREHFDGQPKVNRADVKAADDWLEADANRIKQSLTDYVKANLPPAERGRFITAINNATRRSPILTGDPAAMYRRAAQVAARIEDHADTVKRVATTRDIQDLVKKSLASPSVDIEYKQRIVQQLQRITFYKPTEGMLAALKATKDYLTRQEALGKDVELPKAVLDELALLGKVPAKELPLHVLEALHNRIQLLDQLGRLKVKGRKAVWTIEKNGKIAALAAEDTTPINERPEIRPQPGDPTPVSMRVRNWMNRQLNLGSLIDKALMPVDALFDMLGAGKGKYDGWLFRNVRNPIDLAFNDAQVLRDTLSKPLEHIIKQHGLGEANAERIGVYAHTLQEGGTQRLIDSGVKPETIDRIVKSITPAEKAAYRAMRQAMDSTLPDIQKLMRELYNVEVKPVENYFPMPRDWSQFEPEPKVPAQPKFGAEMDFDELSGWKAMLGDFAAPKSSKTERGFIIERQPGAETPIKINAFDVFHQHINDVAYLLKTQRDIKMIGEMARGDLFADKYGKFGQSAVLSWLDTVARQGRIGGFRRIPWMDELRKRTSVGVIGFRIASQFVHLSNVPLAVQRVGGIGNYNAGLASALSAKGQAFLKANFAETYSRGGGEPALVEASQGGVGVFGKTVVPKAAVRAGFAIARRIDQLNSQATVLGSYFQQLKAKGIDPSRYADMPVDKEAAARAMVLARRAVASPLPKDVPMALSRGAMTGGNISLGRTLFQFQNIFLDQWSNIRHDLAKAGIKEMNPRIASEMFIALSAMLLAETGIKYGIKQGIQQATGYEPKKEETFGDKLVVDAVRRFPFAGQVTSQVLYGETGIPTLDSVLDVPKSAKRAFTSRKSDAAHQNAVRTIGGVLQLSGVPGASQATDLIIQNMRASPKAASDF